jgi:hypothetical protein
LWINIRQNEISIGSASRPVFCSTGLSTAAQEQSDSGESLIHPFKVWSLLESSVEKLDMYMGFTSGFFAGPRPPKFIAFHNCIEKNIPSSQAIAMIDKYYKENPQR